jgi:hypothetical protein
VPSAPVAALDGMAVGLRLAQSLAALDLSALTGHETVLVLKARNRLGNHERGLLLTTIAEVLSRADAEHGRRDADDEADINEVRAALMLSRKAARSLSGLALDLTERLPAVLAAMVSGRLDQPRARIFSVWTQDLRPPHTRAVVQALLPRAHTMTTGQLIDAIQKAAIELDPEWARRRYEKSLGARWVEGAINHDGTADLIGHNLPADEVAAACDRLDALARRVKDAGHPGKLTHIRADIFLGRNGRYVGLTDEQLLAHLIATMPTTPDPRAGSDHATRSTVDKSPVDDDPADDSSTDDEHEGDEHDGDEHDGGDDQDGGGGEGRAGGPPGPGGWSPDDGTPCGSGGGGADPGGDAADPVARGEAGGGVPGRGLRLLVGLGTVAGVDRRPGELLGSGYLHAELARRVAAAPHVSWYLALVNPDGTPIDIMPIRRRSTRGWYDGLAPSYRSQVEVWLQATPDQLARLGHDPPPGWHRILTDIASRVATRPGGPPNGNPADRLPGTALRRWLAIRDRRCQFPGCRAAPQHSDVDHTVEHALGGPTLDWNLGHACGPDHSLRHDRGWHVVQPTPGRIIWTSPLGHTYQRTPPPGPEHALDPMPSPAEPDEDIILRVNQWVPHQAEQTCKFIGTPPPPEPEPQPTQQPPAPREPEEPPF